MVRAFKSHPPAPLFSLTDHPFDEYMRQSGMSTNNRNELTYSSCQSLSRHESVPGLSMGDDDSNGRTKTGKGEENCCCDDPNILQRYPRAGVWSMHRLSRACRPCLVPTGQMPFPEGQTNMLEMRGTLLSAGNEREDQRSDAPFRSSNANPPSHPCSWASDERAQTAL